ncbi:hypothetical protein F4823DRAFT_286112 [Ustulina deusta]|nr:hypothetical protein F4823DRAFT_286112 [Ustulina deusta]
MSSGIFLCLTIVMAICAIIRIAGFHYRGREDDIWEFFWQHTEGAVAVMMASITAFHPLFVKQTNNTKAANEKPTLAPNHLMRQLPKVPSPIFTGMRSFIRRNNRSDLDTGMWASPNFVIDDSEVPRLSRRSQVGQTSN